MQLLFGVLGPDATAGPIFDRMVRLTADTNPGICAEVDTAPGMRLGRHLRSFGRWNDGGGDLTLFLDGEIRAIDGRDTACRGTSDAELAEVAALYRRVGTAIWTRLEGSFCLVIRDRETTRIGFDVGGTRALYWWAHGGVVAFHTRLLDLAPAYPGELAVDPAGIASYLAHSFYPLDRTAFEGIRLVGAGQSLEIERTLAGPRVTTRDHFRFVPTPERTGRSIESLADELNDLLAPAIARSWRAATRPVVPLSGGVDSRYVAAELAGLAGDPSLVPAITWGEDPERPGSDAVVAPRVAETLGIPHTWYLKPQHHDFEELERTIYLTSGEGDSALNYPGNHAFHERLVAERGFESLFRGDQLFGNAHPLLTHRAVFAAAGLARIRLDPGYPGLIGAALHGRMADAQDALFADWIGGLEARTPQARLYELKYASTMRREIIPYNSLKHTLFEVYTPLIERGVLEWIRRLPDRHRVEKKVFKLALARRFPELASIPYATRNNLPDWDGRAVIDPTLAGFLGAWCGRPGWLHTIDSADRVITALGALEAEALAAADRAGTGGTAGGTGVAADRRAIRRAPRVFGPVTRRRVDRFARDTVRATPPGKLVREWTMERRAVLNRSTYHRLSRLAVVHYLVGHALDRHGRSSADAG
jgi:asparagine synthetase B (glutamine-hydrolysing)